ncbi:MAG TPA: hypothetical protein VKZ73_04495 [Microbacterium sp.]|nr:hypothetical protein [Microbacterium sp.]
MIFGTDRPEPWLAAVFEGAGATLWWNASTGETGGEVWGAARASGWLVMPESAMDAPHPRSARTGFFARAAAFTDWREAWWPASYVRGIAPLDPRALSAERAVALAALDGVTDDEDAPARALAGLARWTAELGMLDDTAVSAEAVFREAGVAGADDLVRLADDYGVALVPAPVAAREDYALAAAGEAPGSALAGGSDPVDPGAVPPGAVDPFARIEWRVTAAMALEATVAAAPVIGPAPAAPLTALVGPVEVPLVRTGGVWTGRVTGAAVVLALAPEQRTARLVAPGFEPVTGVDPAVLARIAGSD